MTQANRRLLLGSGGLSTPERRERWLAAYEAFLADVGKVLFVPHAMQDHAATVERIVEFGLAGERGLESLHTVDDPRAAIESAEAIFVSGGNTFRLLSEMQRLDVLPLIRSRVAAGMPYVGISAGSNLACPTIMTTNDMPIALPAGFDGLGLIPFQINPHYFRGKTWIREDEETFLPYGGETRDRRLLEYLEVHDLPVLGICEGGWIEVDGPMARLDGAGARLFVQGQDPTDLEAGSRIDGLLRGVPTPG